MFLFFVSTPEVLERFVTIEKEIVQIEGSVQLNKTGQKVLLELDFHTGSPKIYVNNKKKLWSCGFYLLNTF